MPTARCNSCHALVNTYLHAGRKLKELRCPCGGSLTCAPFTWCRECGKTWYHRIFEGKKICDECIGDKPEEGFPRYRVSSLKPAPGWKKMRSAQPSQFKPIKKGKKLLGYFHISGRYKINRIIEKGSKKPYFKAQRLDKKTSHYFARHNLLSDSMIDIQEAIEREREDETPRGRVMKQVRESPVSNQFLAVAEEFLDYIDDKFKEMKDEIDDRLDNLRLSVK